MGQEEGEGEKAGRSSGRVMKPGGTKAGPEADKGKPGGSVGEKERDRPKGALRQNLSGRGPGK